MALSRHDARRAVEMVLRKGSVWCVTCDKPVDDVEVLPGSHHQIGIGDHVNMYCHRQVETRELEEIKSSDDPGDWFDRNVPRRAFLRNWAGYTIRPARATGRRL